ncbi:hypothetical protein B0H21DRAFT_707959 [Amylocystis lapponica]|nr:hypothetical protein B0H21DRAFT_707959 [Amylocystis lapponica]
MFSHMDIEFTPNRDCIVEVTFYWFCWSNDMRLRLESESVVEDKEIKVLEKDEVGWASIEDYWWNVRKIDTEDKKWADLSTGTQEAIALGYLWVHILRSSIRRQAEFEHATDCTLEYLVRAEARADAEDNDDSKLTVMEDELVQNGRRLVDYHKYASRLLRDIWDEVVRKGCAPYWLEPQMRDIWQEQYQRFHSYEFVTKQLAARMDEFKGPPPGYPWGPADDPVVAHIV